MEVFLSVAAGIRIVGGHSMSADSYKTHTYPEGFFEFLLVHVDRDVRAQEVLQAT